MPRNREAGPRHAGNRLLDKLKGRSFAELIDRANQALSARIERVFASPADPFRSIDSRRSRDLSHDSHAWMAGGKDNSLAQTRPALSLIPAADRILTNRFTLLGHPDLDFGSPIDWHLDAVSGKRAPRIHWSRIPYLNADVVGDHKVVWEINRHQHFYVLGRAYRLTKDEKYARRFAEHLESWMDENPPKVGINWASSLEVSYRAIAWLWAFELFHDSPALTPNLLGRAIAYLDIH